MRFTSDTVADGIREQLFAVGDVPGVLWTPAQGSGPRPLVLIGHGGGQHKKEPGVLSRAFPYVTSCGFAVAPIDAPGTGGCGKADQGLPGKGLAKCACHI